MEPPYDIFVVDVRDLSKIEQLENGLLGQPLGVAIKAKLRQLTRGYLGFDLTREQAQELVRGMRDPLENRMYILPSKYRREHKVSKEHALSLATEVLAKLKTEGVNRQHTWADEAQFFSENKISWTFALGSSSLQERGATPGAIFATIVKLDGHVWTADEFAFYETLNDG